MLEIKQLCKEYVGSSGIQHILQNISLQIVKGEFVMIMGESGSGKSTFLNCISSLDNPTSGEILLNNKNTVDYGSDDIERLRLYEYGFIFQDNHLIDHLTIMENVAIARLQYDKNAYDKARQLLDSLGIGALGERYPHQVSGGEKQRAAIARALINEPEVLFADEPTASLNPLMAKEIIELLGHLNQHGQTIVMVTHSMRMAAYGSRLLVLSEGTFNFDVDMKSMSHEEKYEEIIRIAGQFL